MKKAKEYREQQIAHIAEAAELAYAQHVVRHEQHAILGEVCQVWSAKRPDSRRYWFNAIYHAGPCGSTLLVDGDFGSLLLRGVFPWSLQDIAGWDLERIARYTSSDMPVKEFDPAVAERTLHDWILTRASDATSFVCDVTDEEDQKLGREVRVLASALSTVEAHGKDSAPYLWDDLGQCEGLDSETIASLINDCNNWTPTFVWGISAIRWLARQTSGKQVSTPTFATDGVVTIPSPIAMPEAESLSISLPTDFPQAAQESLRLMEEPTPSPEVRDGGEGV